MKVFVTGATGAIGPHAVKALVADGHDVTALARTDAKSDLVRSWGATPVTVSLFDVAGLTAAFEGFDAVVNLATAIPSTLTYALPWAWKENAHIRTDGTKAVVDAALAAGVGRIVQESVLYQYCDNGSEWIDEESPTQMFSIITSTPISEAHIQRFTEAGGVGVVLRLGLFYGPGSKQSAELLGIARLHYGLTLGHPRKYHSPVNVIDGGSAAAAALKAPAGVYNICDDEPISKRDFGRATCAAIGKRPWTSGPGRLMQLQGQGGYALTRSLRVSNSKFKAATGWQPKYPNAWVGWQETAKALNGGPNPFPIVVGLLAILLVVAVVLGVLFL